MKRKLFAIIAIASLYICSANAYFFNNKHLRLIDCSYGRFGYDYGYVGIYKDSSDNLYKIFFGSKYCEY
ncbi:hypothetical protein [Helicobacter sp. 23-1045]